MKRTMSVVAGLVLAGLMSAYAEAPATGATPPVPPTAVAVTNAVKAQTTCPVMAGNPINKKLYVDYEGKRIYLCCRGCIGAVKKDPAKYVKEMEAAGITLEKVPAAAPAAEKKP